MEESVLCMSREDQKQSVCLTDDQILNTTAADHALHTKTINYFSTQSQEENMSERCLPVVKDVFKSLLWRCKLQTKNTSSADFCGVALWAMGGKRFMGGTDDL